MHSVKDLLARSTPGLTQVADQASRQNFWNDWLSGQLPAALRGRISGVTAREGTLVIFAESAAWSARLRYLLRELEPLMRAADESISTVEVRVLPRR